MAWVRRVRTASGATAVQIAESVAGHRRIVRHVGSARDEVELGLLMAAARRLLVDDAQGQLDLGLSLPTSRVAMVPAPAGTLFEPAGSPSGARAVVAAPRVLRTSSALLYNVLAGVYQDLGFDALGDEVFRDLVIARVVEPTSLLDIDRVLADLGRRAASLSTRKRTLRRCQDGSYRDRLATLCFEHPAASGDVSLCLYDVTTLHFEADNEDSLRKVGYSNYADLLVMPRSSCRDGVRTGHRRGSGRARGISLATGAGVCLPGGAVVSPPGGDPHEHCRRCQRR